MMEDYLASLSRKNRDKALLTQATYNDVLKLLLAGIEQQRQSAGSTADPNANHAIPGQVDIAPELDTAQFRFWVRKMFTVQKISGVDVVAHNGKPVAVQEQLYDILVHCHAQTGHGGRDKTSAMIMDHYSFIPKVFIETFCKLCPGCPRKFGNNNATASTSAASTSRHAFENLGISMSINAATPGSAVLKRESSTRTRTRNTRTPTPSPGDGGEADTLQTIDPEGDEPHQIEVQQPHVEVVVPVQVVLGADVGGVGAEADANGEDEEEDEEAGEDDDNESSGDASTQ